MIRKTPTSLPTQRKQCGVKKSSCTPLPSAIFVGRVHYRFFTSVLRLPFSCATSATTAATTEKHPERLYFNVGRRFAHLRAAKIVRLESPVFCAVSATSTTSNVRYHSTPNSPQAAYENIAHTRRRRQTRRRTTTALLLSSYTSHSSTHWGLFARNDARNHPPAPAR